MANAGVLLARVTQTKVKSGIRYVGVATGMNSLIRPALYGAHHDIVNLTRYGEPANISANVVGPICESSDFLGHDRLLPECQSGDVLLIATAGAYGHAMASNYNLRAPAEELLLSSQFGVPATPRRVELRLDALTFAARLRSCRARASAWRRAVSSCDPKGSAAAESHAARKRRLHHLGLALDELAA